MNYQEKLKEYAVLHQIPAEFVAVDASCHSVEDTARVLGVEPKHVAKNICLVDDQGKLTVAILRGDTRLDKEKLRLFLGVSKITMATKDQVLQMTGYPVGGVPSFGYSAIFVVDEKVQTMDFVYTGGGDDLALIKISVEALLRGNGAKIVSIASESSTRQS